MGLLGLADERRGQVRKLSALLFNSSGLPRLHLAYFALALHH